jgi:hypothetical protein
MHRLTLGEFELTAVSDGNYRLDGGAFFGVVPKVMWEKKVKADAENYVPVGLNSVVVRTGKQTVLIETGIANKLPERWIKIFGEPAKFPNNQISVHAGGLMGLSNLFSYWSFHPTNLHSPPPSPFAETPEPRFSTDGVEDELHQGFGATVPHPGVSR